MTSLSRLAKQLLLSQEEIFSMELVMFIWIGTTKIKNITKPFFSNIEKESN
jgi:hypothetical protein